MAKRIANVIKSDLIVLPYGMLLTRLYRHALATQLIVINNVHYLVDHVMVPLIKGRAHRFMVDGTRPHPQTSLGSSSFPSSTPTQGEVDPVDNFTLDLVVYCDQLPPILGGASKNSSKQKGCSSVLVISSPTLGRRRNMCVLNR
ncbi:hypothetical protein Tco_0462768 [Tanacetum coccineum]